MTKISKKQEDIIMIALGCDHGGYDMKHIVIEYLEEKGIEYKDFGCYDKNSCDYPHFGRAAAEAVASGECEKGIVVQTTIPFSHSPLATASAAALPKCG